MVIAAVACAFRRTVLRGARVDDPGGGSAYTYAYATVGELFAWIIGWDLILEYALSMSTIAVGWSGYFVSLMRDLGWVVPAAFTRPPACQSPWRAVESWTVVFDVPQLHRSAGHRAVGRWHSRIGEYEHSARRDQESRPRRCSSPSGIAYVRRENLTPFIPAEHRYVRQLRLERVLPGAAVMFFAYIGFDAVSTAAQESKNPQRDLPFGILVSLALCTVLYIAVAIVLIGIVPYAKLNVADPIAVGIEATGLTWFSPVVKVSALFGLFSTMLVQLLGQTRIFYSMSRDGLLPPLFWRVHPRFRTPHVSTLVTGVIVAIAAGLLPLTTLSQLVSMGTLLAFTLVCVGIIILRKTAPDLERPFRTPGMPWVRSWVPRSASFRCSCCRSRRGRVS
jgi:APA family basic amino acid/polyamine antiporter